MADINVRFHHLKQSGLEFVYLENTKINYPKHNHVSVYCMSVILYGTVFLKRERRLASYKANDIMLIAPYEPHRLYSEDKISMLSVCIHKDIFQHNTFTQIQLLFEKYLFHFIEKNDTNLGVCTAFFETLKSISQNTLLKPVICTKIDKVKRHIEQHPENNYYLEQMSRETHISKYHFIKKFSKNIGLTPHKFLLQNRTRKAQRLLSDNQTLSMTEIALKAGFYDQSHFIRHFKSIVGLTPSDYKSNCFQLVEK